MCESCAERNLSELVKPLYEFLDSLGVPVLLIESDPKTVTANRFARELLGKELPEIEGRKGGDVIECIYSRRLGGCGKAEHCKACTIRNTVLETFASGKSFVKVRAYPDLQFGEDVKTMRMEVSTEKVGDYVLLRIDDLQEKE